MILSLSRHLLYSTHRSGSSTAPGTADRDRRPAIRRQRPPRLLVVRPPPSPSPSPSTTPTIRMSRGGKRRRTTTWMRVVVPIEGDDGTMDPPSLFVFCCRRSVSFDRCGLFFENTTTFPLGQTSVCPWSVREKAPAFLHTEQWQWSPAPLFGIVLLVLPLPLRTSLTHPNTQIAPSVDVPRAVSSLRHGCRNCRRIRYIVCVCVC